jgi:dihydrofolate reductase
VPQTIVLAFSTLDGIFEDPDGRGGTSHGGWVFRDGPPPPDHFRVGPKLDTGVLLLGRKTWELFSHIWPGRSDDFSAAMNRMPKMVASRTRTDLSAWQNSSLMSGELLDVVERTKADRDVIVTGSASIVHALEEHDRVDEYRILFFPTALGNGIPLFSPKAAPVQLRLLSAEASGPAIFARYERFAG